MKKNIMILAGGTATAWHIVNEIEKYYKNELDIYICDTNPEYLVPSSSKSKKFIQVPYINDENYYEYVLSTIRKYNIDIIIPLIDLDLFIFSKDNQDLRKLCVQTTAPYKKVVETLSNKEKMNEYLKSINIDTPKIYNIDSIINDNKYVLKPKKGFGSRGIVIDNGNKIKELYDEDYIIQEVCDNKEITVEIFKYKNILKTICRERIEVKSGVCTKARIFKDYKLYSIIKTMTDNIEFPVGSCIQFMKKDDKWLVTDINLRLGAGTALATKADWNLTKALIGTLLNKKTDYNLFFKEIEKDRYILRVYDEIEVI